MFVHDLLVPFLAFSLFRTVAHALVPAFWLLKSECNVLQDELHIVLVLHSVAARGLSERCLDSDQNRS